MKKTWFHLYYITYQRQVEHGVPAPLARYDSNRQNTTGMGQCVYLENACFPENHTSHIHRVSNNSEDNVCTIQRNINDMTANTGISHSLAVRVCHCCVWPEHANQ